MLLNVALHGMEQAAGVRYRNSARSDAETVTGCPVLVRYADDYVAICHTREQAEQVRADLVVWLEPRGLAFNKDKTRIVHVEDGFSFLGFDIRRHLDRQGSAKLLIKPSKESVKRLRKRLADRRAFPARRERGRGGVPAQPGRPGMVGLLPERGLWSGLHRLGPLRLAPHLPVGQTSHSNKSRGWVAARYFGMFNKSRRDRWVFGDRDSGAYLTKFSWTKIVRHVPVQGWASPDDPALEGYWAQRRRKRKIPPVDEHTARLLEPKAGAVLPAGSSCCTPTMNPVPHSSGSSGS